MIHDQIIGTSSTFMDMLDQVSRAAPLDRPMLVIGERGTGKEMIASRLHFLSNRWGNIYQKMNCAALTETLLESELFGHEQGAFTGARSKRTGRFEAADQGTLFLDEIGTMSMSAQEKLLRVIEYGEFERVGGTDTIKVNVRVVAATNIDLPAAAQRGTFRSDLLDRLAFDVITLPPLRHRREDIPLLINHFGTAMAQELEWLQYPGFTEAAMEAMLAYDWPGNIRELKNVVERALYQTWDGEEPIDTIVFDPFDSPYRPKSRPDAATVSDTEKQGTPPQQAAPTKALFPAAPFSLKELVNTHERELLEYVLQESRFNQRVAAQKSGLSYDQLRHLLKKHAIEAS